MRSNFYMAKTLPLFFILLSSVHAAEIYNKNGSKLDLYGKVDARHTFSDTASKDGDQTYTRLGFKGETQINDSLTGYGQWEYNFQNNYAESQGEKGNATRLAFAGVKAGKWGTFDYGRSYGVIYDVEAWTDMLPIFGGDSYTKVDNFMVKRGNGLLTWRNRDFFGLVDGLKVSLQYQGKNGSSTESTNGRDLIGQNGDGVGISASYAFNWGLNLAAAYSTANRTVGLKLAGEQTNSGYAAGDKAETWTAGVKYDANQVYLAAMYAQTLNTTPYGSNRIANKTSNIELVAQYQFSNGIRPSLAYVQSKGSDLNNTAGNDAELVKYMSIGSYYYLNKNVVLYADYKLNLLDANKFSRANGLVTDDVMGVGLIYQF